MAKRSKEEQAIIDEYEKGEWKSTNPSRKEKAKYQQYARATLAKDKRVNIRISSRVLEDLQLMAVEEGMPYQTLISSILHKFVNGRLVSKEPGRKQLRLPRGRK